MLQLVDVTKRFGDMVVIPPLRLTIEEGQFVGIIGPNGAGKTTVFGLVSGTLRADTGSVLLDGRNVTRHGADARCRAGLARTFQIPQPFCDMTVYENLLVAASFGAGLGGRRAETEASDVIAVCGLGNLSDQAAGTLTLMQRKRLELGRAMATRPRLLLLDETAGGLTDGEVADLLGLVRTIHASGVTVVWIEHLVHALISVADRLLVLAEGKLIADDLPSAVLSDRTVRDVYLGSDIDDDLNHAVH